MFEAKDQEFFIKYNEEVNIEALPIFSRLELAKSDGIRSDKIYVAIRGMIFDVTDNAANYGPGKSYHSLVGKDCSRQLGLNQLKWEANDSDDSGVKTSWYTGDFDEKQNDIVDKWILFFKKRYKIIGVVGSFDLIP